MGRVAGTEGGLVEFSKRVGVVASAFLAVAAAVGLIGGMAFNVAARPLFERVTNAIEEERRARVAADSLLSQRLASISQDRLDLVDVMLEPAGARREGKLQRIRDEWRRRP